MRRPLSQAFVANLQGVGRAGSQAGVGVRQGSGSGKTPRDAAPGLRRANPFGLGGLQGCIRGPTTVSAIGK